MEKGIKDALSNIGSFLLKAFGPALEILGYIIWVFASGVLYVAGQILNFSFDALVNNMGSYTELWTAVRNGWKAIRDIGNSLFIFALLYAAFNTVLGRKDGLSLVPRIIVVALLVNFSYLFATSVIDVSNEMASQVYAELLASDKNSKTTGFSGQLVALTGAQALTTQKTTATDAGTSTGTVLSGTSYFIKAVFQSAFIIVLSGFFLAIAFMLIARFVTLVVLCLVSALAFVSFLLPTYEKQAKGWGIALIGQAFYAPAILLMLLITSGIAQELGKSSLKSLASSDGQFKAIFSFGLGEFFNFCIIIGLLYASMVLAKKISEAGSGAAISIGQRAQKAAAGAAFGGTGFALRGSLGRLGETISNADSVKNLAVQSGVRGLIGRRLMGVGGRMQDSSFDFRKTGASAALTAATGADYGKVSGAAEKGWKGVAEAKEKKVADRIAAVKKIDLSGDDKKEAIAELVKTDPTLRGLSARSTTASNLVAQREADVKTAEQAAARTNSGSAAWTAAQAAVTSAKTRLTSAQSVRDAHEKTFTDEKYKALNKKMFGIDPNSKEATSKSLNYSTKYAKSLQEDSNSRVAAWTKNVAGVGLGVTALATLSAPAAVAAGAMVGGRLISGTVRGIRNRNKTFEDSKRGTVRQGFFRGLARNEATHAAAGEALKKESKAQEWRDHITRLDDLEKQRGVSGLTGAEKTERDGYRKKVDKHENAGKKKED